MTPDYSLSHELINGVLRPHTALAVDLLKTAEKPRANALKKRDYQTAALTVFLSGIDKSLSLALQLLFLAGKVDWEWLTKGKKKKDLLPGSVICTRGLTSKLEELRRLGLDWTNMQELVVLRNRYVHHCELYIGYSVGIDRDDSSPHLAFRANGPAVLYGGTGDTGLDSDSLSDWAGGLATDLGQFLIDNGCDSALQSLSERLAALPSNPQPHPCQESSLSFETIGELIEKLNAEYIGVGLARLREQPPKK